MQMARTSVPGSGMAAGAICWGEEELGGGETVWGERMALVCGEVLVCGKVVVCGSGVNVGGGALFGSVGVVSNLARAGERLGWYDANRVGSRLRRQSRYSIIGSPIAWLRESLFSSVQIVLSTAGENAGACLVAHVWTPADRKGVQDAKAFASRRASESSLIVAAYAPRWPAETPAIANATSTSAIHCARFTVNPFTSTPHQNHTVCRACKHALASLIGSPRSDPLNRILPRELLSGLCSSARFCPPQHSSAFPVKPEPAESRDGSVDVRNPPGPVVVPAIERFSRQRYRGGGRHFEATGRGFRQARGQGWE